MTAWTIESGRERESRDVEDPREEGHGHADGEPLRREEGLAALQRVEPLDVGSSARTLVLPEEAKVREEGADKRQRNA